MKAILILKAVRNLLRTVAGQHVLADAIDTALKELESEDE